MPPSKSQPKGQSPSKSPSKTQSKSPGKSQSKRYTPPVEKSKKGGSPLWVPTVMFALLVTGTLVIMLNYLGLLPGEQQNRYLLLGLVEITAGFVFATIYR